MSFRAPARGPGLEAYRRARPPRGRERWRSAAFCAVDLELTGLDAKHDEIISFGAVPIEQGRIRLSEVVEGLVRPDGLMRTDSILVHRLRPADLADAPDLLRGLDPLLGAMAGRIPVVHVAEVERSFLRRAFRRIGVRLHRAMIDTSLLGPVWLSERDGTAVGRQMELASLAAALGLPSHRAHRAGTDALTTAEVFLALASHLEEARPETVHSLVRADRRLTAMRLFATHTAGAPEGG